MLFLHIVIVIVIVPMDQPDIYAMYRAKTALEFHSSDLHSPEYKHIVALINDYLENSCKHVIITDDVDNHLEYSTPVRYCDKCLKTFP
jgi:hypothetical protein